MRIDSVTDAIAASELPWTMALKYSAANAALLEAMSSQTAGDGPDVTFDNRVSNEGSEIL